MPFRVPAENTCEVTVVGELTVRVPPDWVSVPKLIALAVSVVVELEVIVTGAE